MVDKEWLLDQLWDVLDRLKLLVEVLVDHLKVLVDHLKDLADHLKDHIDRLKDYVKQLGLMEGTVGVALVVLAVLAVVLFIFICNVIVVYVLAYKGSGYNYVWQLHGCTCRTMVALIYAVLLPCNCWAPLLHVQYI